MKIRSVWARPLLPTAMLSATHRRPSERSPAISNCSPRRSRRSVSSGYRSTPSRSTEIAFSRCAPRRQSARRHQNRRNTHWLLGKNLGVVGPEPRHRERGIDPSGQPELGAGQGEIIPERLSRASPPAPKVGAPSGLPQRSKRRISPSTLNSIPLVGDTRRIDHANTRTERCVARASCGRPTVLAWENASMSGEAMPRHDSPVDPRSGAEGDQHPLKAHWVVDHDGDDLVHPVAVEIGGGQVLGVARVGEEQHRFLRRVAKAGDADHRRDTSASTDQPPHQIGAFAEHVGRRHLAEVPDGSDIGKGEQSPAPKNRRSAAPRRDRTGVRKPLRHPDRRSLPPATSRWPPRSASRRQNPPPPRPVVPGAGWPTTAVRCPPPGDQDIAFDLHPIEGGCFGGLHATMHPPAMTAPHRRRSPPCGSTRDDSPTLRPFKRRQRLERRCVPRLRLLLEQPLDIPREPSRTLGPKARGSAAVRRADARRPPETPSRPRRATAR